MTLTFGFYNSVGNDRQYDAVQISSIFDGIIMDGVFASIGEALMVSPSSGMTVAVGEGRAWFNHTWSYNDADLLLTIDSPHATLPRIDAIVLEINSEVAVRANEIKVIKGTPATVPALPELTNTTTIHQYPLAYISVPVGISTILASHITNKVGTAECPFVTGPLSIVSTSEILAQWEAEFLVWFDEMKDQLSVDAAGNLQLQIDDIEAAMLVLTPDNIVNRTKSFFQPVGVAGGALPDSADTTVYSDYFVIPADYVGNMVIRPFIYSNVYHPASTMYAYGQQHLTHSDIPDLFFDTELGTLSKSDPFTSEYTSGTSFISSFWNLTINSNIEGNQLARIGLTRRGYHEQDNLTGTLNVIGWLITYTADS